MKDILFNNANIHSLILREGYSFSSLTKDVFHHMNDPSQE